MGLVWVQLTTLPQLFPLAPVTTVPLHLGRNLTASRSTGETQAEPQRSEVGSATPQDTSAMTVWSMQLWDQPRSVPRHRAG